MCNLYIDVARSERELQINDVFVICLIMSEDDGASGLFVQTCVTFILNVARSGRKINDVFVICLIVSVHDGASGLFCPPRHIFIFVSVIIIILNDALANYTF